MPQSIDALAIFNCLEALFWITIGFVLLGKSRSIERHRRLGRIAAIWFVLFGISDIFEAYTGVWYRPWPLLVFKGTCIIALFACGLKYRNAKASPGEREVPGK